MEPAGSLGLSPADRSVGQATERFDVEREEFVLRADRELVVGAPAQRENRADGDSQVTSVVLRMEFEEIQLGLTYRGTSFE